MSAPRYRLVIEGELGPRYAAAFDRMTVRPHNGKREVIGPITDFSRLHGLFERIASLGLRLHSVVLEHANRGVTRAHTYTTGRGQGQRPGQRWERTVETMWRERTRRAQESSLSGSDGRANRRRVRREPRVVGIAAEAAAGGEREIPLEGLGGARLFALDASVALLLLDKARYRVVERLFGVPRDQSWPVTLIALALLARAAHEKWDQMVSGPGGPTRSDMALGVATLRELLSVIPGRSSPDTPLAGTLVTIAVAGTLFRLGLSRAVRGIRASAHGARRAFNHRYGHLLPAPRSRTSPQDTRSGTTTEDI